MSGQRSTYTRQYVWAGRFSEFMVKKHRRSWFCEPTFMQTSCLATFCLTKRTKGTSNETIFGCCEIFLQSNTPTLSITSMSQVITPSKTQTVFKESFAHISFDAENRIIYAKWTGFLRIEDTKRACRVLIDFTKQNRLSCT
jgi:hypothetical protein